jgi:hypothetical protein
MLSYGYLPKKTEKDYSSVSGISVKIRFARDKRYGTEKVKPHWPFWRVAGRSHLHKQIKTHTHIGSSLFLDEEENIIKKTKHIHTPVSSCSYCTSEVSPSLSSLYCKCI